MGHEVCSFCGYGQEVDCNLFTKKWLTSHNISENDTWIYNLIWEEYPSYIIEDCLPGCRLAPIYAYQGQYIVIYDTLKEAKKYFKKVTVDITKLRKIDGTFHEDDGLFYYDD